MRNFVKYLKTDIYRAFINVRFFVAVIVVSCLPIISRAEQQGYSFANIFKENSIFQYFSESTYWSEIGIINFIVIAFVYSDCFCDDLSERNYIYSVIRGNINGYSISKMVVVFFNSVITYIAGMLLFAGLSNILFGFQWEIQGGEAANEVLYSGLSVNAFSEMIKGKNYLLFFMCCIGIQSLLYGIASLGALLTSLFIKNKLLILCIPTLLISVGNYMLSYIIPEYPGYKEIYSTDFFYMRETGQALLILLGGTIASVILISAVIKIRLRRVVIE